MTTPRWEIRAMDRWDGPSVERHASARFRVTWTAIRDQLLREVGQLGAALVVIQLVINPDDLRQDGKLRANAKVLHPGARVSFESSKGPLSFATDAYERRRGGDLPGWQANVRAIALGLEALRAVDRYGITQSGQQYQGFMPLADKPHVLDGELTEPQAARVLMSTTGIDVTIEALLSRDEKLITEAYRSAVKRHHPDHGGSDSVLQQIVKARDVLLAAR